MAENPVKPDVDHMKWAINQRANIQHTLLAIYEFAEHNAPETMKRVAHVTLLDHMIAAAFSLWRAVFLAEENRYIGDTHEAQKRFLRTVISTNAISFPDDRRNSAWSVTYYLENAKLRLIAAQQLALDQKLTTDDLSQIIRYLRQSGPDTYLIRYEWECAHWALRTLFKVLDRRSELTIEVPTLQSPNNL